MPVQSEGVSRRENAEQEWQIEELGLVGFTHLPSSSYFIGLSETRMRISNFTMNFEEDTIFSPLHVPKARLKPCPTPYNNPPVQACSLNRNDWQLTTF